MKKILLLLLLTSSFAFSQKCKYEINEIDKFTKEKKLITKDLNIYKSIGISLNLDTGIIGNEKFIGLELLKATDYYITNGSKIMINTSNEVIELTYDFATETKIKTVPPMGSTRHVVYGRAIISNDVYEKLLNQNILDIRLYLNNGYMDFEIKSKKQNKIKNLFACIN